MRMTEVTLSWWTRHRDAPGPRARRSRGVRARGRGAPGGELVQGDGEPEVLVGGTAVTPPYPAWALTDLALVTVARPVRDFHEAVSAVDPGRRRRRDPFAGGLVSPHDPDLDDVVVRDGRAVALIDVDLAGPGSRVRDVACAAHVRLAVTDICRSRAFPEQGFALPVAFEVPADADDEIRERLGFLHGGAVRHSGLSSSRPTSRATPRPRLPRPRPPGHGHPPATPSAGRRSAPPEAGWTRV